MPSPTLYPYVRIFHCNICCSLPQYFVVIEVERNLAGPKPSIVLIFSFCIFHVCVTFQRKCCIDGVQNGYSDWKVCNFPLALTEGKAIRQDSLLNYKQCFEKEISTQQLKVVFNMRDVLIERATVNYLYYSSDRFKLERKNIWMYTKLGVMVGILTSYSESIRFRVWLRR